MEDKERMEIVQQVIRNFEEEWAEKDKLKCKQPLLTIELQDETSIPKVFYKGEEITNKVQVGFDWATKDSDPLSGGMRLNIEHSDKEVKTINTKQINHRIGKYALDELKDYGNQTSDNLRSIAEALMQLSKAGDVK